MIIDDDRCKQAKSWDNKACQRFRISDHEGVNWANMKLDSKAIITRSDEAVDITSKDYYDSHNYRVSFSPFRINYYINDTWVMEVNSKDLLYFESPNNVESLDVTYSL